MNLFKPSPQQEAYVGFDQAWVKTDWSEKEFYKYIAGGGDKSKKEKFYVGYFMQFKVVKEFKSIKRVPKNKVSVPAHYSTPYFRSELKTEPSKNQLISQHHLLKALNENINNAFVYYICPMLFDSYEIYNKPDLDNVQVIDIKSAPNPSTWKTGERHFIMFQDKNGGDMHWCSDPVQGKSSTFYDWIQGENIPKKLTNKDLLNLMNDTNSFMNEKMKTKQNQNENEILILPPSFTVLEFEK